MLVHPDDPTALRAWLGLDSSDRRSNTYLRVRSAARQSNMRVKDFLNGVNNGKLPSVRNSTSLMTRFNNLNLRLSLISGLSGMTLVDQLWPVGDLDCADVRGFATTLAANSPSNADLLDDLTEVITQPELPGVNDDIIRIMSLQKSKGLTARCVVVVGCMEGALPVLRSTYSQLERQQAYEEQRRLFYVALTRTTETLVVSSAATGAFGDVVAMGISPSRTIRGVANIHSSPFLSELGTLSTPGNIGQQLALHVRILVLQSYHIGSTMGSLGLFLPCRINCRYPAPATSLSAPKWMRNTTNIWRPKKRRGIPVVFSRWVSSLA